MLLLFSERKKCPVGELSVRGNVRRGSVRRGSIRSGNCPTISIMWSNELRTHYTNNNLHISLFSITLYMINLYNQCWIFIRLKLLQRRQKKWNTIRSLNSNPKMSKLWILQLYCILRNEQCESRFLSIENCGVAGFYTSFAKVHSCN